MQAMQVAGQLLAVADANGPVVHVRVPLVLTTTEDTFPVCGGVQLHVVHSSHPSPENLNFDVLRAAFLSRHPSGWRTDCRSLRREIPLPRERHPHNDICSKKNDSHPNSKRIQPLDGYSRRRHRLTVTMTISKSRAGSISKSGSVSVSVNPATCEYHPSECIQADRISVTLPEQISVNISWKLKVASW